MIRPEDMILTDPQEGQFSGLVTSVLFKGVYYEIEVLADGFKWKIHNTALVEPGAQVGFRILPENVHVMHKPESSDEEVISGE